MFIYVLALDGSGGSSLVAVMSPISDSSRPIFLQPRGIQTLLQHTDYGYYIATVDIPSLPRAGYLETPHCCHCTGSRV